MQLNAQKAQRRREGRRGEEIHRHTTQTHRHTDTQTHRQAQTQTQTQTQTYGVVSDAHDFTKGNQEAVSNAEAKREKGGRHAPVSLRRTDS